MTSSRVVRGTKGRIFLCICAIVVATGVIACYNNTLSQLDDVRKTNDHCHQQQENLSTQLQVIFEYKQRLEKSLKAEKADHEKTKKEFEVKLSEQKIKHDKTLSEEESKLSSVQQHYKILETQYNDFKEEYSKVQQQQLQEINTLQAKLKEVQGQLKQFQSDRQNSFEHLKNQYLQLQVDNEKLQKQIKSMYGNEGKYDGEINRLKFENHKLRNQLDEMKGNPNVFQPPVDVKNKSSTTPTSIKQAAPPQDQADLPSNVDDAQAQAQPAEQVADVPRPDKDGNPIPYDNSENVIAMPNNEPPRSGDAKSSSTRSTVAAKALSKPSLDIAQPLHVPTVSPADVDHQKRGIPEGVAPIPDKPAQKTETDDKDVREDVNNAFPNRYRANLIANEVANENQDARQNLKFDDGDKENNAVEVFDAIGNDKKPVDNDLFALNGGGNHLKANNELDSGAKANDGKVPKVYDAQDGVDYDKEVQNDMQLEENDPEGEDDDADDYGGHILRRQKDPAVRN